MNALLRVVVMAAAVAAVAASEPTFNWGDAGSCEAGSGSFKRTVPQTQFMVIGVIPAGKTGVNITLSSAEDADVQLVEKATGHEVVAFPGGELSGPRRGCVNRGSMRVCYSGYNGQEHADGQQYTSTLGMEWLTIEGTTDRELEMRAFGFAHADAEVHYSWAKDAVCCAGGGSGKFTAKLVQNATVELGHIPAGLKDVSVMLRSATDLDVRLTDRSSGVEVVGWPNGILKGNVTECATHEGLRYCYSGYNGGGWKGTEGNEWINVTGTTNRELVMSVFGYRAGHADVSYSTVLANECTPGEASGGTGPDGDLLAAGRTVGFDLDAHAKERGADGAAWAAHFNRPGVVGGHSARVVVRRGGSVRVRVTGKDLVSRLHLAKFEMAGVTFARTGAYWVGAPKVAADGLSATLELGTPVSARLGLYSLRVSVPGFAPKRHEVGQVALLFNPWHPKDGVHLESAELRAEYVERTDGRAWYGSVSHTGAMNVGSMAWNYHQHELLERVLRTLGRVELDEAGAMEHSQAWWNDPARVAREVTRLMPQRVLQGRWDNNYGDGVAPTEWSNTRDIFDAALATGAPAKYGQCWVFASVTRSVLSAIGVPSRVVTNFQSAHDTAHPSDFVASVGSGGSDSVWNFHVWNDAWIRRGKVPQWNALDSTPQEPSDGEYQCGPAPFEAVRGDAAYAHKAQYDADFVRAEVGALWWDAGELGAHTAAKAAARPCTDSTNGCSHSVVGQHISTLRPGCRQEANSCRQDVTAEYKPGWTPVHSAQAGASLIEADAEMGGLAATLSTETPDLGDAVSLSAVLAPKSLLSGGKLVLRAFMVYEDGTTSNLPAGEARCGGAAAAAPAAPACACSAFAGKCPAAERRVLVEAEDVTPRPAAGCCCGASAPRPFDVRPRAQAPSFVEAAPAAAAAKQPTAAAKAGARNLSPGEVEHGFSVEGETVASATHDVPANSTVAAFQLAVNASMYARYAWKSSSLRFTARFEPAGGNATAAAKNGTAPAAAAHTVTRQVVFSPPEVTVVPSCREVVPGRPFFLTVSFVNRLPLDLTGIVVSTNGPTKSSDQKLRFPGGVVKAGQRAVLQTKPMIADAAGLHNVVVSVETCQYHELFGSAAVDARPSAKRLDHPERVCDDKPAVFPPVSQ